MCERNCESKLFDNKFRHFTMVLLECLPDSFKLGLVFNYALYSALQWNSFKFLLYNDSVCMQLRFTQHGAGHFKI